MKVEIHLADQGMSSLPREQILGISFFSGPAERAVAEMTASGGLLVAPSGTCFERFLEDEDYRRAITTADLVLPDSGLMVSLWRFMRGRSINRISGLTYLKQLLGDSKFGRGENVCWICLTKAHEINCCAGRLRNISRSHRTVVTPHRYTARALKMRRCWR